MLESLLGLRHATLLTRDSGTDFFDEFCKRLHLNVSQSMVLKYHFY